MKSSDCSLPFPEVLHCFEIRTANVDYFVGQDPLYNLKENEPMLSLPPPDSGKLLTLHSEQEFLQLGKTFRRQALVLTSQKAGRQRSVSR